MCIFKQEKGGQISCKPSGLAQGESCPFLSIKSSTMPAERLLSTLEEALSTWLASFKSPAEACRHNQTTQIHGDSDSSLLFISFLTVNNASGAFLATWIHDAPCSDQSHSIWRCTHPLTPHDHGLKSPNHQTICI